MASNYSQAKLEIDEDVLTCTVCLEIFTQPKVLPCHHSFCEDCLKKVVANNTFIECPICREVSKLPVGGVGELKASFIINNILDSVTTSKNDKTSTTTNTSDGDARDDSICDTCQGGKSMNKCTDCDFKICISCTNAHRKIPATQNHHIISLVHGDERVQVIDMLEDESQYCRKHSRQILNKYCETCQVAICCSCTETDHRHPRHTHRELTDAVRHHKKTLLSYIVQAKVQQSELEETQMKMNRVSEMIDNQHRCEQDKIHAHVCDAIEKLKIEEQNLLSNLKVKYDEAKDEHRKKVHALRSLEYLMSSTVMAAELLIDQENPVEFVSSYTETRNSLEYLRTMDTPSYETHSNLSKFVPMETNVTGNIGYISNPANCHEPDDLHIADITLSQRGLDGSGDNTKAPSDSKFKLMRFYDLSPRQQATKHAEHRQQSQSQQVQQQQELEKYRQRKHQQNPDKKTTTSKMSPQSLRSYLKQKQRHYKRK